ncbi:MAG: hypothetical protein IT214_08015 [Chitinophagaceae bacterium]|jgi:hypothetical protein|nr:hypothetical protein [Chitinophagaceae bacterium]OQY92485.1 MAG: hypothetical protein B6D37_14425 [Sphingobacteriales bacterium UTBCD1]
MKIFFLIAILFSHHILINAQESWEIKWKKKTILTADKEDEAANTRKLKRCQWKKNGDLRIIYEEAGQDTLLWHSFLLFDEQDEQIFSVEKTLDAKIPINKLRELFSGKKQIRIYTIVSPRNPGIRVKMQRVHLCTLQLP